MTLEQAKRYVTVQDAVELLNVSERTVRRMMTKTRLHFIKDRTGRCYIDLDDIEKEQQAKPHTVSSLRLQLKQIQTPVVESQEVVRKHELRIQKLEHRITTMQQQPSHEPVMTIPCD